MSPNCFQHWLDTATQAEKIECETDLDLLYIRKCEMNDDFNMGTRFLKSRYR